MTESGHAAMMDCIVNLADMVRREGMHDFRCVAGQECQTASLCGVCVHMDGPVVLRIHAHDMDIECIPAANDPAMTIMRFRRGGAANLARWHRQLSGFYGCLRPLSQVA
jgi:hypothetical protein